MTRQDIIDLANVLTENKGKPIGQKLQLLYSFIVQDICKRKRYWWRKQNVSFSTAVGTKTYDLAAISTTPALTEISVEEIRSLQLVLPSIGNVPQFSPLTPVFDDVGINSIQQNSSQAQPSRYYLGNNDYHTLVLDPPDAVYTMRLGFWAMATPASDSSNDVVPLIPPWGHNTIVEGMCAYIWENAYGLRDERTIDYKKRYEDSILNLQMRPQFTTDYAVQLIDSTDSSIRST